MQHIQQAKEYWPCYRVFSEINDLKINNTPKENGKTILLAYLCLNTKKLLNHINKEKPRKAMIYFSPIKFTQLKSLTRPSDGKIWRKHGARSVNCYNLSPSPGKEVCGEPVLSSLPAKPSPSDQ